jgi:hypothetical protein
MAIQTINVGNIANDGTGDDLREAFIKVNDNFTDLNNRVVEIPLSASNIGTSGQGVYADTVNNTLQFKKLVPGQNTSITANNETITISTSGGMSGFLVLTNNGSLTVDTTNYLALEGRQNITTTSTNGAVFFDINPTDLVVQDTNPRLGGNLNADQNNIVNVDTVSAGSILGNLTGLVHGIDIRDINQFFDRDFDFGPLIDRTFDSIIDFIIKDYPVDIGGLVGNEIKDVNIDLGPLVA